MKKVIRSRFKLLLALLLVTGFTHQTYASHYQGGDLTYLCVAPNVYVVTGKIYRDCSGATLSTSETLNIDSPGCNAGRSLPMPLVPGSVTTGVGLYCQSVQAQAQCTSSATLPNFETGTYRATVTFSTPEQNCQTWLFSMRMGNRPSIENLGGSAAQSTWLYSEAMLRLSNTINNNSPEFAPSNIPVPFVCVNQPTTISMNAAEADGDSLSYELARPLDDYNMPIPYSTNNNPGSGSNPPGTAGPFLDPIAGTCVLYNTNVAPSCSTQYRNFPTGPGTLPFQTAILPIASCSGGGGGTGYSQTYPLPVGGVSIDWTTGCRTSVPVTSGGFVLDPLTGVLNFTPSVFHASAPIAGRNKYAVVVQINEWRKINGVMTKVGHIRRDILVIVNQCANTLPGVVVPKPANITGGVFGDTVFNVQTCTTTRFMIKHTDINPGDLLNITFPDAVVGANGNATFPNIPGLVMRPFINNMNTVNVAFYMTPNTSAVNQDYLLRSVVKDNACPLNGRLEKVYRIHINASNRVAPVAGLRDRTICLGDSTPINVALQRPDSIFINNTLAAGQYTFLWTDTNPSGGLPNGLNLANQNDRNITVKPTQTTRYFLSVTSTISGCRDTTSVIVRVDTKGLAQVSGDEEQRICFGDTAIVDIVPDTVNGLPVVYTSYQWSLKPGVFFDDAGFDSLRTNVADISVNPIRTTRYYLTATNSNLPGCPDTTSVLVRVDYTAQANLSGTQDRFICENGSTPITVSVNNPDPLALYTYEWYLKPGVTPASAGFDVSQANSDSLMVNPLVDTRYFVRVRNGIEACPDTGSVLVRISDMSQALRILGAEAKLDYRNSTVLSVFGANSTDRFEWRRVLADGSEDTGTIITDPNQDKVTVNPLGATGYSLRVINSLGCDTTLYVMVTVGTYFPNVITPNNDGKNDWLEIPNLEANTQVQIYNRWGALVKEYKNYENVKGKAFDAKDMSDGTYYYYIKEPNGKKTKGWFDIIDSKK